ncbi:GNAT family N-acetyltransferase [Asticcacaulis taihuensis]|uniref:GNAT family N-acetyltransferase n=1 Tax=Asticcacaulis taihuensis TaxID=260084 RepID=UPI0026F21F5E|nr:GNAT family N-acetyltransferase [Asticcacaulis taihuensis]
MAGLGAQIADPELIATWLKGWALAHEVPLPAPCGNGWHVEVGLPDQKARYVFAAPEPAFWQLAETITEPLVYLKVCAPHDEIKNLFPSRWATEHRGFMMTRQGPPPPVQALPAGHRLTLTERSTGLTCTVHAEDGSHAASGSVVLADDMAVYDRIRTEDKHRRKGLGSVIMTTLQQAAHDRGRRRDMLCASHMGRPLYETLGWQVHSLYTSAVILP